MAKINVPSLDFKVELTPAPAAAAMKAADGKKTGDTYDVPLGNIRILEDFNVRVRDTDDYKAGIIELKDSVIANGFYRHKPLAGYAAKDGDATIIYIEDGHRRLEAVEAANFELGADAQITSLPVVVAPQQTTMEDMLVNLVQSNSGKDLIPYEKGVVVKRLLGFGLDKKTIATRLGFTPRYIDDLLVLVAAPVAVRNLMLSGQVSSTQTLRELRKDPAKAAERLQAAVKKATEAGKSKATAKDTDAANAGDGPKMMKVSITVNFGKGDVMGAVLKVLAGQLRESVSIAEEGDLIQTDGSISVTLNVPTPEPAPAPPAPPAPAETPKPAAAAAKPAAKPAAAAKPAKGAAAPKGGGKGAAAAKTAAAAKAAGLVPAAAGEPDPLAHALGGGEPAAKADDGLADL